MLEIDNVSLLIQGRLKHMDRNGSNLPSQTCLKTAPEAGFTLVEISIAVGLVSILAMALISMNTLTSLSMQANAATDEFNQEASLLLTVLNSKGAVNGSMNGCTAAFLGMPVVAGVPVISTTVVPSPSPLAAFTSAISTATQAVALYTKPYPSTSPSPPQGLILQVTAPTVLTANAFFPPPINHLWVTSLTFNTPALATGVLTPPLKYTVNPVYQANLYQLHLSAQKVSSNGLNILGGQTIFSKDFLVTLWVNMSATPPTVVYCGDTPP
jgi:prepilin-type N-terminal cleavage/methylation domain-containing protein